MNSIVNVFLSPSQECDTSLDILEVDAILALGELEFNFQKWLQQNCLELGERDHDKQASNDCETTCDSVKHHFMRRSTMLQCSLCLLMSN